VLLLVSGLCPSPHQQPQCPNTVAKDAEWIHAIMITQCGLLITHLLVGVAALLTGHHRSVG
jgi:hypothetical protein